jgi:hypothetical protein
MERLVIQAGSIEAKADRMTTADQMKRIGAALAALTS